MPVKLNTKKLDELRGSLQKMGESGIVVGLVGKKARAQHRDRKGRFQGITVAVLARIHEYGYGDIPARPFFGPTMASYRSQAGRMAAQMYRDIVNRGGRDKHGRFANSVTAWRAAADFLVEKIRDRIASGLKPELAESTRADPKRNRAYLPLFDTGQIFNAIGWEEEQ